MVYFGFDSPTTVKWSAFRWRFAWFVKRRSSHRPTVDRWRVIIWLARSPIALWWILAVKFVSTSSTERLILWRYFLLIRLGANFGLASCLQTRISQVPQALHAIRQRSLPKSADPFLKTTSFLRPTWKFNVGQVKMWILCYYICVIVSRSPFRFFSSFLLVLMIQDVFYLQFCSRIWKRPFSFPLYSYMLSVPVCTSILAYIYI